MWRLTGDGISYDLKHTILNNDNCCRLQDDVLIKDDSMNRIFHLEVRTHFGYATCELVVEGRSNC